MNVKENYQAWLDMFSQDSALVGELESIRHDEKEIEDRFYTELSFGTAGMRGIMGAGTNRMNIYNVRRLSAGLADYLNKFPDAKERGIVVGYDSRHHSEEFARQAALVFAARGVKALLFDALRPVPVISFAVRHLNAAAGVAITASHNPSQYNGYKVYGEDGAQAGPEMAQGVSDLVFGLSYQECLPMEEEKAHEKGLLKIIGHQEVDDDYIKMVLTLLTQPELVREKGADLKIIYTPLHGSGNIPVRRALKEAGIVNVTIVPEQEQPDGAFPTVKAPNPEDPDAFRLGIALARKVGASVVFATDPDCDRLGASVKDAKGEFHTLSGNQIGCLLLHHILESKKKAGTLPENGAAVKSFVSTNMAQAICDDYDVKLFETLTGFKYIGELIEQFVTTGDYQFLFGFEESYGYLSGTRVRDKDAVNASLLIAEAACVCMTQGKTLYEKMQELYQSYGYYLEDVLSVTLPGKDGLEDMERIMKELRGNPPDEIAGFKVLALRDYLTGLRIADGRKQKLDYPSSDALYFELQDGHWCAVRPSGTEPKIKFYTNTVSKSSMEEAQRLNRSLMANLKARIGVE